MGKIKLACIVDDDPIFVFGIKKMIELTEFCESFLVCSDGQDALNKLGSMIQEGTNVPDVILLDLNMPVMDGWEFLDRFTKIETPKKILIYVVSSSIDQSDIDRALSYSVVSNYIVKPIITKELSKVKSEILQQLEA